MADLIHHAEIQIDLTDQVKSISESYRYTLCDEEGNAVDARQITTNVEEVHVDVPIQRIKEVKMAPGCDGVETGVLDVAEGQSVKLYVKSDVRVNVEHAFYRSGRYQSDRIRWRTHHRI